MSCRRPVGSLPAPGPDLRGDAGRSVYVSDVSRRLPFAAAGWLLLPGSLPLACGERAGDPVVALNAGTQDPDDSSGGGAAGAPDSEGPGGDGAVGSGASSGEGPSGLCAPCESSSECGDANDACVVHAGQRFCGRDCEDQGDCPDGYACQELRDSQLWQCVPEDSCSVPEEPPPALDDLRSYVLALVNGQRFAEGRLPLGASSCLNELAQQSAVDYARSDEPLGKYVKECDPIWPACACGWWAEAEVTVARYGLDWHGAVERAFSPSRDGSSNRFVQAYLSSAVTDVGIGFWLSGDEAWIALSFR